MITARQFTDKLFESFCNNKENEKEMFLIEELIVDERHKKVRLTDEQNKGVDFSNNKYLNYRCHQPTRLNTSRLGWSKDRRVDGD
jgi:hypothetical protein